jgi:hypothetical protein
LKIPSALAPEVGFWAEPTEFPRKLIRGDAGHTFSSDLTADGQWAERPEQR